MKSILLCLAFTATCGAYSSPLALAQTVDTTSAWRYFPLEVGNVWEYGYYRNACEPLGSCHPLLREFSRWTVERDSALGDLNYKVLRQDGYSLQNEFLATERVLVRFDTLQGVGVKRNASGGEEVWPGSLPCRLDAPLGDDEACGDMLVEITFSDDPLQVSVNGEQAVRVVKRFVVLSPYRYMWQVPDLGLMSGNPFEDWNWIILSYAHIGDLEYGTERFPIVNEPTTPENIALTLAVFPNPSQGDATVRFALDVPQRVTLAVFDVLGRRVLATDLGVQPAGEATHRLDAAALQAGLYVVRLTGDAGASVTARIVRH